MKTRSVRLKFKSFAKRLFGFLVTTCPDRDSAEIEPQVGNGEGLTKAPVDSFLRFGESTLSQE